MPGWGLWDLTHGGSAPEVPKFGTAPAGRGSPAACWAMPCSVQHRACWRAVGRCLWWVIAGVRGGHWPEVGSDCGGSLVCSGSAHMLWFGAGPTWAAGEVAGGCSVVR